MKESHLRYLVCPRTLDPLSLEIAVRNGDEIVEGALRGPGGEEYPIRQSIPSFVEAGTLRTQTVQSFAQKWAKHRYYREHTSRFYTEWYLQRYGLWDAPGLERFLADKRLILDAGTGAGRDAANLARHSSATVFAVDTAWDALEVARSDLAGPQLAFIHADLHHLPLPDEFLDFINCDQVIHHTPDPRAAFEVLRRKLKTGGEICCYVYRRKAAIREFTDDFIRERIKDLPVEQALTACEPITKLGRALAGLNLSVEVEEDIPILGIRKGKIDLQRFFHWNILKCFWNDEFDFFTNNIINFDWYHPEHCHRFEPEEFRAWFASGWQIKAWDVQEAGISCRARKL